MSKRRLTLIFVITILGIFSLGIVVGAATAKGEPGSVNDPLVTQSYLEEALSGLSGGKTSESDMKALGTRMDKVEKEIPTIYIKVSVPQGKTIKGSIGTEMILYSGSGKAVSTGTGLINLTNGSSLTAGKEISRYNEHLVTIKNSGINATKKATVFVKGTYTLE